MILKMTRVISNFFICRSFLNFDMVQPLLLFSLILIRMVWIQTRNLDLGLDNSNLGCMFGCILSWLWASIMCLGLGSIAS